MKPSTDNCAVELDHVTKLYSTNAHSTRGISDVSLCAQRGELLLILGPSGSGKTTIITLAAGLLQPTHGVVRLFGRDVGSYSRREIQTLRARHIGFVFQSFLLIESLTIAENIRLVQRFAKQPSQTSAEDLLRRFSIEHLASDFPARLSQGEKQRAAIARALANNADLILADEPTASLESTQGLEIIQLLRNCAHEQNKCVIVVSHDLRICEYADRIVRIEDGKLHT